MSFVIDTPPFRAYPVTGGITFTYGGVKVSQEAAVLNDTSSKIEGLFACGEMVGGVFLNGCCQTKPHPSQSAMIT